MSRDLRHGYHKGHQSAFQRKSQQKAVEAETTSSNRLVWIAGIFLSVGLLLGYFVVYHFATQGVSSRSEAQSEIAKDKVVTTAVQALPLQDDSLEPKEVQALTNPTESAKKPTPLEYSFYHGLSETEVVVDAEPIPVALPVPYYIQAGTFGTAEQAEREQARLKSLGEETQLTIYQGKKTYYRLRVGPFEDRLSLNKKRNELAKIGVDTLLVKSVQK